MVNKYISNVFGTLTTILLCFLLLIILIVDNIKEMFKNICLMLRIFFLEKDSDWDLSSLNKKHSESN